MTQLKQMLAVFSVIGLSGALGGCSAQPVAGSEPGEETLGDATEELTAATVCPAGVPATLLPPANETILRKVSAVGVQTYMCSSNKDGAFVWTFVAPQANLFSDAGKLIGTHFIGPTWQTSNGSSVVGKKAAAYTADPSAVPWLLLTAASHSDQAGLFHDVSSIQRLSTVGGNAPADGCDQAHAGSIAQIPYSADYVFYRVKPTGAVQRCGG
ncbi:MAG TPA: DUF3455 domain-containing protein [Polyangiaceae bacterium]|nr:DUF3455 domain-containing protein [Polyangiaceae bacterium]